MINLPQVVAKCVVFSCSKCPCDDIYKLSRRTVACSSEVKAVHDRCKNKMLEPLSEGCLCRHRHQLTF